MVKVTNLLQLVLGRVVGRDELEGEGTLSFGLTDRIWKVIQNQNEQLEGKMRNDK